MSDDIMMVVRAISQTIGIIVVVGRCHRRHYIQTVSILRSKVARREISRTAGSLQAQQKELEQLRFKITALLDRATKLHSKEFDILPEAWAKITDAHWKTRGAISFYQEYPDLSRMMQTEFESFVQNCPLRDWEKAELLSASDRQTYYRNAISWHNVTVARGC